MRFAITAIVLATAVAGVFHMSTTSSALAQGKEQAVMLRPGVYTTPSISRKCQAYVRGRVRVESDNARTRMFIACVQYLYERQGR